ncbi:MAG: putative S-layer protein [Candidatus Pacearchaeota archaeon]
MTNKTLSLLSLGILALLVLTSFASATPSFSNVPSSLSTSEGYHTYNITMTNATSVSPSSITITEGTSFIVSVSFNNLTNISTISYTVPTGFEFEWEKEYSFTITANDSGTSTSETKTLSFEENTNWYEKENKGNLKIKDVKLDTKEGFGDEDEYWYPLDEVEITFTIDNDGNYDIENIELQICMFDESEGECVFDEEDMELDNNEFDLDENDDQDVTVTFQVDADKLNAGNTDYTLYIKAFGELVGDDAEDDNVDGDETGISYSKDDLEIVSEDFVIVDNIQFSSTILSCGDTVELTADVWNIDNSDLDDDEVYVLAYNKELGINKVFEFNDGIDSLESESITLPITLEDVDTGNYVIKFTVYNDNDLDDDNIFETSRADDEEAVYYAELKVEESCSTSSTPTASVSAKLDSEAKAGQQLIVKATIVNTGSTAKTFTLSASSYADWASSATLDKNSITLNAGASQEVSITLEVLKDAEGENGFDIEVVEGNKFLSQPVAVTIEKASFLPSFTGLVSGFSDNAYLYGIGALNILLVAAIIFVAVKVARRKKQE